MSRPATSPTALAVAARLLAARRELPAGEYAGLLADVRCVLDALADAGEPGDADLAGEPEPAAGPLLAPPSVTVRLRLECAPEARYYAATPADAARLRLWLERRRDLVTALRRLGTDRIEATAAGDDLDLADLLAGGRP